MRKARWIALSALCIALFSAASADEPESSEVGDEHLPLPPEVIAGEGFFEELQRAWRWQAPTQEPVFVYTAESYAPLDDLHFREGSSIERVARLRSVSLLTLAEARGSRLYFGVNDNEVLGIHFGAVSNDDGDRYFEIARMPWLHQARNDDTSD